jgi:hypothetical protein
MYQKYEILYVLYLCNILFILFDFGCIVFIYELNFLGILIL